VYSYRSGTRRKDTGLTAAVPLLSIPQEPCGGQAETVQGHRHSRSAPLRALPPESGRGEDSAAVERQDQHTGASLRNVALVK